MNIKTILPILLLIVGCANNLPAQTNRPASSQTANNVSQGLETMSYVDIKKTDGKIVRLVEPKTSDDYLKNLKIIIDNELLVDPSIFELQTIKFLLQATDITTRKTNMGITISYVKADNLKIIKKLGIFGASLQTDTNLNYGNGIFSAQLFVDTKGISFTEWEKYFPTPIKTRSFDLPKDWIQPTNNGVPVHVQLHIHAPATKPTGNQEYFYESKTTKSITALAMETWHDGFVRSFSIKQLEK